MKPIIAFVFMMGITVLGNAESFYSTNYILRGPAYDRTLKFDLRLWDMQESHKYDLSSNVTVTGYASAPCIDCDSEPNEWGCLNFVQKNGAFQILGRVRINMSTNLGESADSGTTRITYSPYKIISKSTNPEMACSISDSYIESLTQNPLSNLEIDGELIADIGSETNNCRIVAKVDRDLEGYGMLGTVSDGVFYLNNLYDSETSKLRLKKLNLTFYCRTGAMINPWNYETISWKDSVLLNEVQN